MTLLNDGFETLSSRDDDEGLFSRDFNGELIRLDAPREADYMKNVKLQIDGESVTVPLAEPLKDSQGNVIRDIDGQTTPRYTTIFDAAVKLRKESKSAGPLSIPILCHQPHMTPVAVCRLCVVQIYGTKRGKRAAERKLLPACQHQVKEGMEVFTMNAPNDKEGKPSADGARVRKAVNLVTELLTADHLKPAPAPAPADKLAPFNELQCMNERLGLTQSRFKLDVLASGSRPVPVPIPPAGSRGLDLTSPVFVVDHSACILCDRCSRSCDEVKKNNVIGRTGKGATAGIGFDLNDEMGDSSCVQCGECMVSCPTSAITFKPSSEVKIRPGGSAEVLQATEVLKDDLFREVPPKFLLWQNGLVVRRKLKAGDVLCKQDDPGNTAFIIKSGTLQIKVMPPKTQRDSGGLLKLFRARQSDPKPLFTREVTPADLITGEMACLSGSPRTADVIATTDGEVWEIRRNVLDRLMRSPSRRSDFDALYKKRAVATALQNADFSRGLKTEEIEGCAKFVNEKLTFVRVSPGQVIFRQGDYSDGLYLVRLGHVRVDIELPGREPSIVFLAPGSVFGEIGSLALGPEDIIGMGAGDIAKRAREIDGNVVESLRDAPPGQLTSVIPAGQRTATCTALDHLELARLNRESVLELIQLFPTFRLKLIELSLSRLLGQLDERPLSRQFVELGLYQGQSLLVLDLDSCTRCDECTRACVQQHGNKSHGQPITRLLRDGLRFGNTLVATSCRSCKDAYCMIGCPVDSIHRGKHLQIVIEDHCIGCGLCERNCPYGNITMEDNLNRMLQIPDPTAPGGVTLRAQSKASTCDLCDAEGELEHPQPRCVYACPHDSAHRMNGAQLLKRVTDKMASEV